MKDATMIAVIKLLPEFVPHQRLVFEYVELFHIGPPIRARKLLRILTEVAEIFKGQAFSYQRARYEISRDGVAEGLRGVCNANIKGPLTGHNYLKKILIDIAENEKQRRQADDEKKLRQREERLRTGGSRTAPTSVGDGVAGIGDVPGKVRELLDKIG